MRADALVPIAVTQRSGRDESVHFGVAVALSPNGSIEYVAGDPTVPIYPRSSNKPMQAVAMVRNGLLLPPNLLALVCASHDGSPAHLDAATQILAGAGLTPDALGNTADLPLDRRAASDVLRAGGGPTPLRMNCSGKHAGMLATSVVNGWPLDRYVDPDHPLQRAITATIEELAGEQPSHIGIDGCGAPAHMISLLGLAQSFRRIATGQAGSAGDDVAVAMSANPQMVGGPRRDVTRLMEAMPGLVAKDGAEGVFAAAFPDGRAVALKIADGADRARPPVLIELLRRLDVDVSSLVTVLDSPIFGHGQRVGSVRSTLP